MRVRWLALLPLLGCLAARYEAGEGRSFRSRGSRAHEAQGAGRAPDMRKVVASLTSAAQSIDAERQAGLAHAKSEAKQCAEGRARLGQAITTTNRTVREAKESLQVAEAEVQGLQADVQSIKAQLTTAGAEVSNVTDRLQKLRAARAQMQNQSQSSLQQIQAVIARASLREREAGRRRQLLAAHASQLQELGSRLAPPAEATEAAPSFLELASEASEAAEASEASAAARGTAGGGGAAAVLGAERQEFLLAREDAMRGFNQEEAKLMDMLKLLREEVRKLESDLAQKQPSLADKIRQAAEVNMTLGTARRTVERDDRMLASLEQRCKLMEGGAKAFTKLRREASDLLWMPAKLLEKMSAAAFLAQDVEGLGEGPPQLLQLGASSGAPQEAMRARLEAGGGRRAAAEPGPASPADVALVATAVQALQAQGEGGSGPFDGVTKMIQALIASLRSEANQDMTRQQFCADSQAKNLNELLQAGDKLDVLASQVRWAKAAIVRLEAEVSFAEGELARLAKAAAEARAETDRLQSLSGVLNQEHQRVRDLAKGALDVVQGLCGLSGGTVLLQQAALAAPSNCAEAARMLQEALLKIDGLSSATSVYLQAFTDLNGKFEGKVAKASQQQDANLMAAKSASAQRANELATAEDGVKVEKENVRLLQKAKGQLEKSCGPQAEPAQDRLQRRADEIQALKGALAVLEGQAVPV